MKRTNLIILLIVISIILTSCASTANKQDADENSGIVVDKGLTTTSITVPANFFTDMDEDDIEQSVHEKGFNSYKINSDGSVTYTMSKSKHKELMNELSKGIEETINTMIDGDDRVESFVDIKHNTDFSQFDILVDKEKYTMWDSMYILAFYLQGAYYQIFNGTSSDKVDVIVNFIDNATGENIESGSYKAWSTNIQDNTNEIEQEINEVVSKTVTLNETFKVGDIMEITLTDAEWVEKILPTNTSGFYSYYDDVDGEKYFVIHGKLKNLGSESLDIQWLNESEMIINNNYKFSVTIELEENDGSSFYGVAKPLQTLNLIIYASITDEVYDIWETIDLEMKIISDDEYYNNFFDDSLPHEIINIRFTK